MHNDLRTAAVLCTVALTAGLVSLAPASATPSPTASGTVTPRPPARMSTVGGERLGLSGVQVQLRAGAPALPAKLSALSWIVSDTTTGLVLAAKNAHWALPPASTLKTLFADTVLPKIPTRATHKVTDADLAGMGEGSSLVGVLPGQTYKVSDLWLGVFLRSGNDAVHVLASMNGGVAATVAQMQAQAVKLGAGDTHVVSPDGYDMPGQVSSAYDLSLFARDGMKNADFARYAGTWKAEFPGGPNTKGKPFEIDNTDRMLMGIDGVPRYDGLIGVKNGYTTNAGNTLVVAARRGGRTIMATLMNPQDHALNAVYTEAAELLDWGFAADGKVTPVGSLDAASPKPSAAAKTGSGGDSVTAPSKAATAPVAAASSAGFGGMGWAGASGAGLVAVAVAAGGALLMRRRRYAAKRRRRALPRV
ncbi:MULTISPECIES: D-alanyl-D-alanine carboxypeptidase family protein [Streptacidiphilus]|uniref:D-alanyl-D-alanine carboxypeptidase family protein n=1 Tax=Streptacidiphilus cavernicola TaxID=3342716 RepID=A0ABV6USK7_9ACTN|nr:D-alanyl-D-alanine carboxypeptidase [Streptacidiphilus jeojiense]